MIKTDAPTNHVPTTNVCVDMND